MKAFLVLITFAITLTSSAVAQWRESNIVDALTDEVTLGFIANGVLKSPRSGKTYSWSWISYVCDEEIGPWLLTVDFRDFREGYHAELKGRMRNLDPSILGNEWQYVVEGNLDGDIGEFKLTQLGDSQAYFFPRALNRRFPSLEEIRIRFPTVDEGPVVWSYDVSNFPGCP